MTTTSSRSNRLAQESSPYLLLHAHNPVDWYPWGDEAIERARAEGKPIFLSVGYSTCYWCHVMERESFSDPNVAELMNREFVNIKLDREERPELDEIYMMATQILAGQGGWPNSVFLTPDLKPFFAGTYFPPEDHRGRPSFRTVLSGLAEAWKTRRADVGAQAEEMGHAMRRALEERGKPGVAPPAPDAATRALDQLARRFDLDWGGFGSAPKFPSPSNLHLLLDFADEREEADKMLTATLDGMAMGGLFDQLAGGFHRYATDREWKVPHFEKMLYDNGLLLEIYARAAASQLDPFYGRTARATADFLAREMTSAEGAFWSAIDAETDGREGAYYAWTRHELEAVLGREDYAFLAPLFGFDGAPFFEGEHYVLHLPERLEAAAAKRKMELSALLLEIEPLRERLLAARFERKRPATDDKVLTDWNGAAIAGLAVAGRLLAVPEYVERAARAATFLLANLRPADGPLQHVWRAGVAKVPALLSDYVFLVRGLLALHRAENAEGDSRWLTAARELVAEQDQRLGDSTDGNAGEGTDGWFAAAESADVLFRSKEVFDGALPAANALAIDNLLDLFELTGEERFQRAARRALAAFATPVHQHPDGAKSLALAARRYWREAAAGEQPVVDDTPTLEALAAQAEQVVAPQFEVSEERVDGWRAFRLVLEIAEGWHLNANPASLEQLVPTRVDAQGARLERVIYPAGSEVKLGFAATPISVYQGRIEIRGEVALETSEARLLLTYQPCDDNRCLPPITRVATLG